MCRDKHNHMKTIENLTGPVIFCVLATLSPYIGAQEFSPALTEYGHPDFRGVWNFSNKTPLERPERYAGQEFLEEAELENLLQTRVESAEAANLREATVSERILNTENASSVGAVNNFWFESDALGENGRTSLVVYPMSLLVHECSAAMQME